VTTAQCAISGFRLHDLGVQVKIATGDNPTVAQKLYADIGMPATRAMTGPELDQLSDDQLRAAAGQAGIFARVSPQQKARLIRVLRREGRAVGFLGDGVNDALALHDADVGISVEGATDVAKDAADVILLEKSLDVLADGVNEGRRIFANTIKYVLMGTASNFCNIFSAAAASAILTFLPLLPSQPPGRRRKPPIRSAVCTAAHRVHLPAGEPALDPAEPGRTRQDRCGSSALEPGPSWALLLNRAARRWIRWVRPRRVRCSVLGRGCW